MAVVFADPWRTQRALFSGNVVLASPEKHRLFSAPLRILHHTLFRWPMSFDLSTLYLVAAMVAAIALTMRERKGAKAQRLRRDLPWISFALPIAPLRCTGL